jgi:hypothetical protein
MSKFKVNKQTDAQKDEYLFECFHDNGIINELIAGSYSIISGRTGSGKTAIARYMEKKGIDYEVGLTYRISIKNISLSQDEKGNSRLDNLLFFIAIKTVEKLLEEKIISNKDFWKDFFVQNGIQPMSDYESFVESRRGKDKGFSIKGTISGWFAKGEAEASINRTSDSERTIISKSPVYIYEQLKQSLPDDYKIFIFIDDISDYLDHSSSEDLQTDIQLIRGLMSSLSEYSSSYKDARKDLRFISLFRDDLFSVMEGSSVNKLRSDALKLEWNEKDFASLLIRRLPFFSDSMESSLKEPIDSIKKQFPDKIFSDELKKFETNRYSSNFYAYVVAISFNRPRDFLSFCYAMRDRLSTKNKVEFSNIEAAEIEYSEYFSVELRDELSIASRILGYSADQDNLNQLVDLLSSDEGLNSAELRNKLGQYLGTKTSLGKKKIQFFIEEMWRYGVLGIMKKEDKIIRFNYTSESSSFSINQIKEYTFYLHRGLWWFVKKYKSSIKKK